MNKSMTTTILGMTIGCAATLGCSAALASPASAGIDQPATYVVRFADLDLSRIDGAATVYTRIRSAARQVCTSLEGRDLGLLVKYRACVDKAIADAVASVNRPLLSQYHQLHTKGDKVGVVQLAKVN
jgi:UrcA family protein